MFHVAIQKRKGKWSQIWLQPSSKIATRNYNIEKKSHNTNNLYYFFLGIDCNLLEKQIFCLELRIYHQLKLI